MHKERIAMSSIPFITSDVVIASKNIFLRADLNVPIKNGIIQNDAKLRAIKPTIERILSAGGKITLATHIGRPLLANINDDLSTKHLCKWFCEQGFLVEFESNVVQRKFPKDDKTITLLENLRFWAGEQTQDLSFATLLAKNIDVYTNESFGTIHRIDTSTTILPSLFSRQGKFAGPLVQQEIAHLDIIRLAPRQPFIIVLGGSKLQDKIPLIRRLIQKPTVLCPCAILIGGALAIPFLASQHHSIVPMLIDATIVEYAKEIMQLAIEKNITLVIPKDIIIKRLLLPDQVALATSGDYMKMDVEAGVTYIVQDVSAYRYHEHDCVVDIGPKTIALYISHIAKGKTIFANGTMGIYENQESSHGTAAILSAIASNNNMTILGGGDCVAAAEQFQVGGAVSFLSTGGGATLAYLAAGNPYEELPGLHALII